MLADLIRTAVGEGAGIVLVALVMIWFGAALRSDRRLTRRLEDRVTELETDGARDRGRIGQLEQILREHGIPVPPWPAPEPASRPTHRRKP